MELTNDPHRAEVVVFYLLNIDRALLIDRRGTADSDLFVEILPQRELLLQGRPIHPPLTPEIVRAIESRRSMPRQPGIMQSYLQHIARLITSRLADLRAGLPAPTTVSIGPHFAPTMLLASSDFWHGFLRDLDSRGDRQSARHARQRMNELLAWEIEYRERSEPDRVQLLREDYYAQEVFKPYGQ